MGVYVISIVSNVAADQLTPYLPQLLSFFNSCLDETNTSAAFYAVMALTNFAPLIGQDHMVSMNYLFHLSLNLFEYLLN